MSDTTVCTKLGQIKGHILKDVNERTYYSFRSIPYAKPPIGNLRFAAPEPPEPWDGVRDGSKECNICAQFDINANSCIGDEDCLYLNVFTPKLPSEHSPLLPVIFYIHGGGFVFGNGTDIGKNGPEYLVAKNVVIVTINYRLGVLGFLSLGCKEAPGNVGLKDQVQALKWVQQNISCFNGDPSNVTIFGISAGAAAVDYHLLSPMSKGLFHKAIANSGASILHWAQNDADKIKSLSKKIASLRGMVIDNDSELYKFLLALPIKDLISTSMSIIQAEKFKGGLNYVFLPVIEKQGGDWEPFLDKSAYQMLSTGNFAKVPFMTGISQREGLLITSLHPHIFENLCKENNFLSHFPFKLNPSEINEFENRLRTVYLEKQKKSDEEDANVIDFFTDVDFLGGIYVSATLKAKHSYPVYFYEFVYDGALNYLKKVYGIPRKGAAHADEEGYLMKCSKLTEELSADDIRVRNIMTEMWTNFAKYGDPTPDVNNLINTKWEPMSATNTACLVIDKNLSMKYKIYSERTKLYEEVYRKKFGSI